MQQLEDFKSKINGPKQKIVITTHHKPDADALGSSLGLKAYLDKKGHKVTVITPSDYPAFLYWMKGNDTVINYEEYPQKSAELVATADMIFATDFSCLSRINDLGELVQRSKAYKVNIDHHQDPKDFADIRVWDTAAAATCELVYQLIVDMGDKDLIDKEMAECLYAGIMTDTGGFRHPNTTKNVHLVVAELIDLGADGSRVTRMIYDTNSVNRLKFIGFALSERLVILPHLQAAYFAITKEDLEKYHSKTGDTEGIVNYALSLEGIKIAALFTEREDAIKISFRSVEDVAVNKFAAEFFDGGGHKNASGGKSYLGLKETTDRFEQLLAEKKEELYNQK
ncbi:DHH family phosphoesterase [Penaeicola halotolerans]|uniref:DHH family phosphoesterase n=1 Tax=Penaeicola halotolerans TaxID=2793196 RepID=UPI001CF91E6E|nr:bifunctional oligoribonuclease/PAP phosphatase NrnA [Penaeicola halotolerans]